ncbi:hypothetical protein H6771_01870 [Candidatus Peribacteria bacterium]|nr:hypothetical protein [Candidatus Peribacteria bacterium]
MQDIFIAFLSWLYGGMSLVNLAGYLPTIRDLWRGRPSINLSSYAVWTFGLVVALLYGIFKLHDTLFILTTAAYLTANVIIIALYIWGQYFRRKSSPTP